MANVLHVVSYFPPDRIGGVGEVVAHVHRALLGAGHRSVVLTAGRHRGEPDVLRIAASPLGFAFACARHVAAARRASVVHMHHGEGLALLVLMRILFVRTPVLLTLHVGVEQLRRALAPYTVAGRRLGHGGVRAFAHRTIVMRVREWLDRAALALADRVSFISHSAASDVLPADRREAARVIYNGVSSAAAPVASSRSSGTTDLLFVGTDSVRKRVASLPLILAAVRERRPDARLRIVGIERDDNPELLRVARELGVVDAIDFAGRTPPGELGPFYRAARVLLVPSAYEGLPMVILEAFQHGLPCVATRVSGHPEVIEDGVNGFLVALDHPGQMADAALRILEDPELGKRLGAAGLRTVATRFTVERQVSEYLALYAEL